MAKGRLYIPFISPVFGRVFLGVSFLVSFSFVGASDLSLYVAQFSYVSPYMIRPPNLFFLLESQDLKHYLILRPTAQSTAEHMGARHTAESLDSRFRGNDIRGPS